MRKLIRAAKKALLQECAVKSGVKLPSFQFFASVKALKQQC
jgi:hypothetical protein